MKYIFLIFLALSLAGCATAPKPGAESAPTAVTYPAPYVPVREISFMWPVKGSVSSYFGAKFDRSKNRGVDILCNEDTDVRAARAGRVVFCDEKFKGFGKTVMLEHGDGLQTVYAYNSAILVRTGDEVAQGSVIARSGRSGRAKEPSLHFEIRKNGEPMNPLSFLS
jgi:murein DD-endopeptidase MepM/ murein hydrolase activator NlpD